MSIAAFFHEEHESPGKLVGCNIIGVSNKTEVEIKIKEFEGRCMRIIVRDLMYVSRLVDVFEKYGMKEFMTAIGLVIDTVYRGQGLGLEIMKARFDLDKAVGLKVTQTVFTGIASLTEVPYEDFKENGQPVYPGIKCKLSKMSAGLQGGKWQRPESVPVPKVWKRYTGPKAMENGKVPKFIIQDVPKDKHEEILEFMSVHFFRDEALCSCLKVNDDPVSSKEFQKVWKEMLEQNISLVAFVEGDDGQPTSEIAGANVLGISHKTDHYTADMYASHIVDVFEHFGVEEYMTAMGLCVDPKFRGQGLGLEILKARFVLGKALGVEVTHTAFTGMASQTQAQRAGFELLSEVFYEDFKDEDGKPVYPNIRSKSCKIMASRIK
ncbi:hypothetical protein C0J52_23917 [Blattella germanica]|nr:hypothetical protein C0J52_23917 [Blattella germanica]